MDAAPDAPLTAESIIDTLEMETVWMIEVEDFPAFVVSTTTAATSSGR